MTASISIGTDHHGKDVLVDVEELLATRLLVQGNSGSEFAAYNSATGERLWSFAAQTGVVAPPITYTVNGEQYVAVLAGWGGATMPRGM